MNHDVQVCSQAKFLKILDSPSGISVKGREIRSIQLMLEKKPTEFK